jgi:hypothetical protein
MDTLACLQPPTYLVKNEKFTTYVQCEISLHYQTCRLKKTEGVALCTSVNINLIRIQNLKSGAACSYQERLQLCVL